MESTTGESVSALKAKSIVLYYSLGGSCEKIAETEAELTGGELYELTTKKKRGRARAMFCGTLAAVKYKKDKLLRQIDIDFDSYDDYTLVFPLWAGAPAPAFNNVMESMPKFKKIKVIISSNGGKSLKARTKIEDIIIAKQCKMVDYSDRKSVY